MLATWVAKDPIGALRAISKNGLAISQGCCRARNAGRTVGLSEERRVKAATIFATGISFAFRGAGAPGGLAHPTGCEWLCAADRESGRIICHDRSPSPRCAGRNLWP